MEKRYQVFVSSTYEDLKVERNAVIQALLELDCIPAGMELFPASGEDQWSLIKDVIDDCDYYLLIIGGRYGSIAEEGISYTHKEYEYAKEQNKPIIAFVRKNLESIPNINTEKTDEGKRALEEFINEVQSNMMVKYWETPDQLAASVVTSMHKIVKRFPAEGWIKAGSVVDEASIKLAGKLQEENHILREENERLRKQMAELETNPPEGMKLLAQGDDKISVEYMIIQYNPFGDDENVLDTCSTVTWRDIFTAIAPHLVIYQYDVLKIGDALNSYLQTLLPEKQRLCSECRISDASKGEIFIQLKALGYIKQDAEEKRWRLTSYGDYALTQLVAKKTDTVE